MPAFSDDKPTRLQSFVLLALTAGLAVAVHWTALADAKVVNGPDIKIHFRWALQFAASLAEGNWYPRWAAYSYYGLGDPTFLYIHPLFYYLAAAANLGLQDIWRSVLWVGTLTTAATALVTYGVARQHTSRGLALCAAFAVTVSPYAFHLAHYQQFLPMHFAMPAVVLFVGAVWAGEGRFRIPFLAVSLAVLVGSHILAAFMVLICTGVIVVWRAIRDRQQGIKPLLQYGGGVALGLGLAAAYLLPALSTQHLVSPAGWYAPIHLDWRNAFLLQYFSLPSYGFRWFHLQWTIPLLTVMACLVAGYFLRLAGPQPSGSRRRAGEMLAMAVIALFLGCELVYPLWEHIGVLRRIQFPLRFLQLASIAAVLALVWSATMVPPAHRSRVRILLIGFLLGSLAMLVALERQFAIESKPVLEVAAPSRALGGQPEMKPATAGAGWRQYLDRGGWMADCANLGLACTSVQNEGQHKIWAVERQGGTTETVRIPVFWFPAWQFSVDGKALTPAVDALTGLPEIPLSLGKTVIEARWVGLPQEHIGLAVSGVSLLLLGGLVLVACRLPRPRGVCRVA